MVEKPRILRRILCNILWRSALDFAKAYQYCHQRMSRWLLLPPLENSLQRTRTLSSWSGLSFHDNAEIIKTIKQSPHCTPTVPVDVDAYDAAFFVQRMLGICHLWLLYFIADNFWVTKTSWHTPSSCMPTESIFRYMLRDLWIDQILWNGWSKISARLQLQILL